MEETGRDLGIVQHTRSILEDRVGFAGPFACLYASNYKPVSFSQYFICGNGIANENVD